MRTKGFSLGLCLAIALVAGCKFSPHPPNGAQACSNDNPPQCPDGYACFSGYCYLKTQPPGAGGSTGADAKPDGARRPDGGCPSLANFCGTGSGKRCGSVTEPCGTTVNCGNCTGNESCQTGQVCGVNCGQAGQPCCTGSQCTSSDTVCAGGLCTSCGGANQLCCANDACSALGAACAPTVSIDAGAACLLACATITGACVTGTDQDCVLQCGPAKIGSKTCACTADNWKCPGCTFPQGADYSCYKLPATVPACAADAPVTVDTTCTAAACSVCGSSSGKAFIDGAGTARSGYCACINSRWNCTLTRDWPCPGNNGC